MSREAIVGCNAVFIQDSKGTKVLEFGVVVLCKRKGVIRVQPAMIGMATLTGEAGDNFCMRELGHDLGCSLCCCGHELYGVGKCFSKGSKEFFLGGRKT